jgi:hypothetical protein
MKFFSGQTLSLAFSSAFGALLAVIFDMAKGQLSTIENIRMAFERSLEINVNKVMILLIVIGIALALSFIEDVSTKLKAFTVGMGVLSTFVNFLPAPKVDTQAAQPATAQQINYDYGLYSSLNSLNIPVFNLAQVSEVSFRLIAESNGGEIDSATVTIRDFNGAIVHRSTTSPASFTLSLEPGSYMLIVEAAGYEITNYPIHVSGNQSVTVQLRESWVPLPAQRVLR